MSAFDDEFGLFGDETDDSERRATLGARRISGEGERVINDVEPEETRPAREERRPRSGRPPRDGNRPSREGNRPSREQHRAPRDPNDPWAGHRRATELLGFVARKLVQHPDGVAVELFTDETGQPVIELVVASDDLGKVIGRNGRVAHALRTIVRATAEGRVSVDILDADEAGDEADGEAAGE